MADYTLTAASARKLARLVDRFESTPVAEERVWHEYRSPASRLRQGTAGIVIGKTTAAWAKGTTATVAVWAGDPLADTGNTTTAVNLFADIEADKWVAMLGGYLISAEC